MLSVINIRIFLQGAQSGSAFLPEEASLCLLKCLMEGKINIRVATDFVKCICLLQIGLPLLLYATY